MGERKILQLVGSTILYEKKMKGRKERVMEGNNGVTMEKLTDARRKEEMKKRKEKKIKMHMEALTKSSWEPTRNILLRGLP